MRYAFYARSHGLKIVKGYSFLLPLITKKMCQRHGTNSFQNIDDEQVVLGE